MDLILLQPIAVYEIVSQLAAFRDLFQKKWFLALFIAMIILLIIETSLIIFFVVVSGQGRQAFPSLALSFHLRPGCSDLTATMVSSTASNRTFDYSCSGSGALRMPLSGFGGPADCCGADSILVSPTFTLPQGYLSLSLVNTELSSCKGHPQMQLQNGQNMTLGGESMSGYALSFDYCAVIAGQTGNVQGFSIVWNYVPWPGLCCTLSATPTQLTIPAGQNASSTVTITARGNFFGNVSLSGQGQATSLDISSTWTFAPRTILVKPQGSNTTTVTISILRGSPQTFTLTVYTYPNRYYSGDTINITVKVT